MQNFSDLLNGVSDGTKDLSISALTVAGTATLNGHVNLGNSSADDLTITASLAATLPIKTNTSYDIGSATKGLQGIYLGASSTFTANVVAASHAASRVYTIPDVGAASTFVMTGLAQTITAVKTFSSGINLGNDNLTVYRQGTWTPNPNYASGTAASITVNSATYTRIGNRCHVNFDLSFRIGTGSGAFTITGLPFTAGDSCSLDISYLDNVTMAANTLITAHTTDGGTSIGFFTKLMNGSATGMGTASATQFASSASDMRIIMGGMFNI